MALHAQHRWCLSGTPLQNRVGELYSLVQFVRLDPYCYYFCRVEGCECKCREYRFDAGYRHCEYCGHGPGPKTSIEKVFGSAYEGSALDGIIQLQGSPSSRRRSPFF